MFLLVIDFREFRTNKTRAKHKTTGTIISSSNCASSNNAMGLLMQFRCVLACVYCAAQANNPFLPVTVKFQYENGCNVSALFRQAFKNLRSYLPVSQPEPYYYYYLYQISFYACAIFSHCRKKQKPTVSNIAGSRRLNFGGSAN